MCVCVCVCVCMCVCVCVLQVIDWREASIQVYEEDLSEVMSILKRDVSPDRLNEMQLQVRKVEGHKS